MEPQRPPHKPSAPPPENERTRKVPRWLEWSKAHQFGKALDERRAA